MMRLQAVSSKAKGDDYKLAEVMWQRLGGRAVARG